MKLKFVPLAFVLTVVLIFSSCNKKDTNLNFNNPTIHITINRFEQDLFKSDFEHLKDSIPFFEKKYGDFFEIFTYKIIAIGGTKNPVFSEYLKGFVTDYSINEVYTTVTNDFTDLSDLEQDLSFGFSAFLNYFPQVPTPRFYTFISGFNQSIVTSDSIIGIGLDKYLGLTSSFYQQMNLPLYMRYLMNKERITSDCLKAWLNTNFEMIGDKNLLNNMIYQGKITWCMSKLMPEAHDSLLLGIEPNKIKWCKSNEEKMWTYLVEYKKLYSTDILTISKFINEGPFTKDFSTESPAKAAVWIGYRIVDGFMNREKNISPDSLMKINDYQEILRKSKYNP